MNGALGPEEHAMSKVLILYGSTTGQMEEIARFSGDVMKKAGIDIQVRDVRDVEPRNLKAFDVILFACSTWEGGELQQDFLPFEKRLKRFNLEGKKTAVMGTGNLLFKEFCVAVDTLEKRLKNCGAEMIVGSLRVDGSLHNNRESIKKWTKNVISRINK
jgi:flavodoxin I